MSIIVCDCLAATNTQQQRKDRRWFVAEMSCKGISNFDQFIDRIVELFKFPEYETSVMLNHNPDAFQDLLCDLHWLDGFAGISLFMKDYRDMMKDDPEGKGWLLLSLLSASYFWSHQVERVVAGGRSRPFELVLADSADTTGAVSAAGAIGAAGSVSTVSAVGLTGAVGSVSSVSLANTSNAPSCSISIYNRDDLGGLPKEIESQGFALFTVPEGFMKDLQTTKAALESSLPIIIMGNSIQAGGAQVSLDESRVSSFRHRGVTLICTGYPWDNPYKKGIAESLRLVVDVMFALRNLVPKEDGRTNTMPLNLYLASDPVN